MADQKRGPVKPPTIDLTAKSKPEAEKAETSKPTSDSPRTKSAPKSGTGPATSAKSSDDKNSPLPILPIALGVAGGGLLGLALAIGLASAGFWPQQSNTGPTAADLDQLRTQVTEQQDELASRIAAIPAPAAPDLSPVNNRLSALEQSIASLTDQVANIEVSDSDLSEPVAALQTQLTALETRLDAVSAGASSEASQQLAETIGGLQSTLTALTSDVETAAAARQQLQDELASLNERFESLAIETASLSAAPRPLSETSQFPLAINGLQSALDQGRAFEGPLGIIETLFPDLPVEQALRDAASTGLVSAADLEKNFTTATPAMLAARPAAESEDLSQAVMQRVFSLLALRSREPLEGDSPDAVFSRLEHAISIGDDVTAFAEFSALPVEMQQAAPDIAEALQSRAALTGLINQATARALSTDEGDAE